MSKIKNKNLKPFIPNKKIMSFYNGAWSFSHEIILVPYKGNGATHICHTKKTFMYFQEQGYGDEAFYINNRNELIDYEDEPDSHYNFGWVRPIDCNGAEILSEFKAPQVQELYIKLNSMQDTLCKFHLQGDLVQETTESIKKLSASLLDTYMISKTLLDKYCQHDLSL